MPVAIALRCNPAVVPQTRTVPDPLAHTSGNEPAKLAPPRPARAHRDRVIERLSESFAEDRLSVEEFEHRVELAYSAATSFELDHLIGDIGAFSVEPAVSHQLPARVVDTGSMRVSAIFSSSERSGPITLPERLEVVAILGSIELDLRSAVFASPLTTIDVKVYFGSVELTLPPGMQVDVVADSVFGGVTVSARDRSRTSTPAGELARVTGRVTFGSVQIDVG